VSRREEWQEQIALAELLDEWLDPTCSFWTATDPVAPTRASGAVRKKRGVKPGVCDVLVWHRGRSIGIELKAPGGRCSASQRAAREALLRAGVEWWECRSASAAMWALAQSGVRFREWPGVSGADGRWCQPPLQPWEVPRRDPAEKRPLRWDVQEERRIARRRWREAAKARRAAPEADLERDNATAGIRCNLSDQRRQSGTKHRKAG